MVVILRCDILGSDEPINVFVDLKELDSTNAETISHILLLTLESYGFNDPYLKKNLIGFCSDGASTMLGCKSGVSVRLLSKYPGIIIWHCLSHRVQLALDDAIKSISQVNHFKAFLEKIYCFYHTSNKNQMELNNIANDLELEIIKIGRVLGPRWVACSVRATKAVWKAYPALYNHFSQSNQTGLKLRMENLNFIEDLALMTDLLEELSLLSLALQSQDVTVVKADRLIKRCIRALSILKDSKGKYESLVPTTIKSDTHKHIPFSRNNKIVKLPRNQLIQSVIDNMTNRLGSEENETYKNMLSLFTLLDSTTWPSEVTLSPWYDGEKKLYKLSNLIKFDIPVNDFRDLIDDRDMPNKTQPGSILQAKKIMKVIAVSSAEAERAFSLMNIIATDQRNALLVSNISHLMTIKLIGKPISDWDPTPFVKLWLRQGHHTATDTRVRRKVKQDFSKNQSTIWSLL